MQNPLKFLYPDQCVLCGALVEGPQGLCAACWAGAPFIDGLVCDICAVPLLGEAAGGRALCDDCLAEPPPWNRGRAVMSYRDTGRRLVLALKHGDRIDLVRPAARWLASHGRDLVRSDTIVVPVPLHWTRLLARRFNQASLLACEVARIWGVEAHPDALRRVRRTPAQERMTRAGRVANVAGAIVAKPAAVHPCAGRPVVIVDDVMTSGATLSEAARALARAGAAEIDALVLARVVKDA